MQGSPSLANNCGGGVCLNSWSVQLTYLWATSLKGQLVLSEIWQVEGLEQSKEVAPKSRGTRGAA